ncbi:MAG: histidine--tRNA ligase [Acidimicrobiales bacterium]|nr:histidine--tRNA ligase [Acidimicrobiales bacterium]
MAPESDRQRALVAAFADVAVAAGYGQVISPIFEDVRVFHRLGEANDVVTKEMYDFEDKDGRHLALRPELTASIVRAFVQHRPRPPWKAWYEGPQFRHEKPQAGRYRQFTQIGVEVLGPDDPHVDVEVIALAWRFYESLGLSRIRLLLNTLGDPDCRPSYLVALETYLNDHRGDLSEQSQATLATNPLRVLDSKREPDQAVIAGAPLMVDHLSDDAGAHFSAVTDGLQTLGIPYEISPRLVRGLDYYVKTTFEFAGDALESAQNALGGGGRYDDLAEQLGGPATPGIGFALGVDRILLACDAEGVFPAPPTEPQVFVVDVTGGEQAMALTDQLRQAGLRADRAWGNRSMKAQMKVADRSGAAVAVLIGEGELANGTATVRDLRGDTGQQEVSRTDLVATLQQRFAST